MPQAILTAPPTSSRWQAPNPKFQSQIKDQIPSFKMDDGAKPPDLDACCLFWGLMIEVYVGFGNWDLELLE
jgi:hypothetical protein